MSEDGADKVEDLTRDFVPASDGEGHSVAGEVRGGENGDVGRGVVTFCVPKLRLLFSRRFE